MKISFILNGKEIEVDVPPSRRVVDLLREDLNLTGTKEGCGEGECAACSILVDGESRLSCLMLAPQIEGRKVTTIEGLASGEKLHPVQEAFVDLGAVQCGFCTPGMILTAYSLLKENPEPTDAQIIRAMDDNLCRCGAQVRIIQAIRSAAQAAKGGRP